MALRLLQHQASCGGSDPNDDALLCPWIKALPRQVTLPHIHFGDGEIAALQDPDTVQEVQAMRLSHDACFHELQEDLGRLGYGRQDFDWAVAVLHSRCFVFGRSSTHMVVPGVDMANHSFTPNAAVRCDHSPGACQGTAALEEVCPPGPLQPAVFQLLAGPHGTRENEEVTISYGDWPNDVFLLFFGFLPDNNQHDAVVLFRTLEDLVICYQAAVAQQQTEPSISQSQQQHPMQPPAQQPQQRQQQERTEPEQQHQQDLHHQQGNNQFEGQAKDIGPTQPDGDLTRESLQSLVLDLQDRLGQEDWSRGDGGQHGVVGTTRIQKPWVWGGEGGHEAVGGRTLVVTAQGFDGRLLHAAQQLVSMHQAQCASPAPHTPTAGMLLAFRCAQMLAEFATTAQEDAQQLRCNLLTNSMQLAVRYRLGKKHILQQASRAAELM
ncbi:hypothetical protein ABBQ32_005776 [Trebouxia sp. C0010 RCD-2024]